MATNSDILQLTNNSFDDYSPQISGKYVAWYAYPDFSDSEIFFYNGSTTIQLTNNSYYESLPSISGNKVVWQGYDGSDDEIYLYNGSKTVQLTNNNFFDYDPHIDGNKVVWTGYEENSDSEIYLYDGSKTVQLTNNDLSEYGAQISGNNVVWTAYDGNDDEIYFYNGSQTIQLTDNVFGDYSPQISGNNVVWQSYDGNDDEIYLYNGSQTIQLTDNFFYDYGPRISGNKVVWAAYDGNDEEIFLYDGSKVIQLTDNNYSDYNPQISGDKVVWSGYLNSGDAEIFFYDGDVIQLTDNDTYEYDAQISGNKVVWSGWDGSDQEIYLYEIPVGYELVGTEEDDVLTGGRGRDTLSGLGGDDVIQGKAGNDTILGGDGNDLIAAGDGKDTAEGGLGNDSLSGNGGNDSLLGDRGQDNLLGGEDNDYLDGGEGNDRLLGQQGDDTILGQAGNDTIDGGDDADSLTGGAGSDRITGGSGIDNLDGGAGADSLTGGLDSDSLNGGGGNDRLVGAGGSGVGEVDTMTGGAGSDIFVVGDDSRVYYDDGDPLTTGESDYALITDYNASLDTLQRKGAEDLYRIDEYTTPEGTVDKALIYDPGVAARGELIAILQGVGSTPPSFAGASADATATDNSTPPEDTSPLVKLAGLVEGKDYVAGELIVKIKAGSDKSRISALQERLGATVLETTKTLGIQRWRVEATSVREAIANFSEDPTIEYIEPNYIVRTTATTPTDPRYNELWGLNNTGQTGGTEDADIDAPEAWDLNTGSSNVVVGVIDTGVDYNHPDLNDNIWTNPGEVAGDGIDNDGNGYVDDIHGYDFAYEDSDPMDVYGHGTHVAGTIAAEANNGEGVTGVNWKAKIMALKFLTDDGYGYTFDAIQAVEYATLMKKNYGVNINLTNNSWGGGGYDQGLYDAIAAAGAAGQLFIAAAGNYTNDNDLYPFYPATYDLNNVISVAATDHNDGLAYFSNYGATTVDLGAPGVDVLSTIPNNSYAVFSGTSMATPHVAGVASLLWSQDSSLSAQEVKEILLKTVDPIASLAGKTVSGGRLNAFNALSEAGPPNEIIGTEDDDELTGTNRRDRISGLGGNDVIQALAGNDVVLGGNGADLITAAEGNDTVEGGNGSDQIFGNEGDDALKGDVGADRILGGDGNDAIGGGNGNDRLLGEEGDDIMTGDRNNDTLDGGDGNDALNGGSEIDRLFGGSGNDGLVGDAGNDSLTGGLGSDSLDGGAGNDKLIGVDPVLYGSDFGFGAGEIDVLTGLGGNDTFVLGDATRVYYSDGDTVTTGETDYALITDFNASQDTIQLHGTASEYLLDFYTTSSGSINAALIYDPGVSARGELIGILQNVSADLTVVAPAFTFV
jgi:beta propeller repeat protein